MGITQTTSHMGSGCRIAFLNRLIENVGIIISTTLHIRTRMMEIDPGQAENGIKTSRHENFKNREFGKNSFISNPQAGK